MPEAVVSNSTPVSQEYLAQSLNTEAIHNTIGELEAFSHMLTSLLEGSNVSRLAAGIDGILQGLVDDLEAWVAEASSALQKVRAHFDKQEFFGQKPDLRVFEAVRGLALRLRIEQGLPRRVADWTDAQKASLHETATTYKDVLLDAMENKGDVFEAGTFFPWIEARMRRELSEATTMTSAEIERINDTILGPSPAPTVKALRDQFIRSTLDEGFGSADVAMALGLSTAEVDRTIERLGGPASRTRKAM